ncbi:MAG: hypothetical protein K2H95_06210 [Bacteroidales bacterium]|nr:hypothetical protein [Bacteroidales bacterium]MDE6147724.1 hypothetical protein [Bacteroidales bacterium]
MKIIQKIICNGSQTATKYESPEISIVELLPEGILCSSGSSWEDFGEDPWLN